MQGKQFIVIFAVLVLAVTVLTVAGVRYKDTEPPTISFGEETVHLDGTDVSRLLEDVQASDKKDGDVSDSLIISRLYQVSDNAGVVIYAAKDEANNVSVRRRSFTFEEENKEAIFAESGQGTEDPDAVNGDNTDPNGNGGNTDPNGTGTDPNGSGTDPSGNGQTGVNEPEDDLNGSLSDREYAKLKAENQEKGYPYMRLKVHTVTLHVGDRFSIYTYIDEVEDDVDTINTMLRLEHNVDTSTPGVYQAEVYARDSEGHVSNKEYLKVTVVE